MGVSQVDGTGEGSVRLMLLVGVSQVDVTGRGQSGGHYW